MSLSQRARSPSHAATAHAIWPYEELKSEIDHFLTVVFPKTDHEGILGLPGEVFAKSVQDQGQRSVRYIAYDDSFRVMTMPLFDRQVTVRHNRGIRCRYFWFWCQDFTQSKWRGKKVTVRYEPEDPTYVQALLGEEWVRCKCKSPLVIGYTWRSLDALAQELLAEARKTNKNKRLEPIELERHLARIKAKEIELTRKKKEALNGQASGAAVPKRSQTSREVSTPRFTANDFAVTATVSIGEDNDE